MNNNTHDQMIGHDQSFAVNLVCIVNGASNVAFHLEQNI